MFGDELRIRLPGSFMVDQIEKLNEQTNKIGHPWEGSGHVMSIDAISDEV